MPTRLLLMRFLDPLIATRCHVLIVTRQKLTSNPPHERDLEAMPST
jgi:hypothetical protein